MYFDVKIGGWTTSDVAICTLGYSAVFFAEIQGNGLGDLGGYIGAAFACVLLLALVSAAIYETFKPAK